MDPGDSNYFWNKDPHHHWKASSKYYLLHMKRKMVQEIFEKQLLPEFTSAVRRRLSHQAQKVHNLGRISEDLVLFWAQMLHNAGHCVMK